MPGALAQSDPLERVRDFVKERGLNAIIRVLPPESTKTSAMAATALRCTVAEIAKTIAFIQSQNGLDFSVLVSLSGSSRVSLEKLSANLGVPVASVRKMSADEVKSRTGYSIGGVPPFPHNQNIRVLADESLLQFSHVWAAAGTNSSVMRIEPSALIKQLRMPVVNVSG